MSYSGEETAPARAIIAFVDQISPQKFVLFLQCSDNVDKCRYTVVQVQNTHWDAASSSILREQGE